MRLLCITSLAATAHGWKWGSPDPNDGDRCGPSYSADCRSGSKYPCCSPSGWCGASPSHCDCPQCVDFTKVHINDECSAGTHECVDNEYCLDTRMGYECRANECTKNPCGDNADCTDTTPGDYTCECQGGFDQTGTGKTITCTKSGPPSPCPSDKCWTFANNKCTLIPGAGCTELKCEAKSVIIGMTEDVLGKDNGATGASPTLSAQTVNSQSGFGRTCNFGDCNMAHEIVSVADGKGGTVEKLQLTIDVTQKGNDRTRSLVVDNKKIDLGGGLELNTAPFGVGVQFICLYSLEVEVTSADFSVTDVTITGATEGQGTLNDGFELTVAPATGANVILGSDLTVKTTWEVNLPDLKFYYKSCDVKQGTGADEKTVTVVKETCFASVLGAGTYQTSATEISYVYRSFTIDEAGAGNTQSMTCTLTICKDNCNMATASTQCPAAGDDANFKYSWDGNTPVINMGGK